MSIITRKDYLAQLGATDEERWEQHHRYYAQFVTEETIADAVRIFGTDRLRASTDRALNDTGINLDPYTGWRRGGVGGGSYNPAAVTVRFNREALYEAHGSRTSSNSDIVCILKTAARIWLERDREGR